MLALMAGSALLPSAVELITGRRNNTQHMLPGAAPYTAKSPNKYIMGASTGAKAMAGTLMPMAMIYASSQLMGWSNQNMQQTGIISEDRAKQLALDYLEYEQQDRYLDLRERELEDSEDNALMQLETGLAQSAFISITESDQQTQRLQAQQDADYARLAMEQNEQEVFQTKKVFNEFNTVLQNFGYKPNTDDIYKISCILPLLRNLLPKNISTEQFEESPINEEFDYSQWHEFPGEYD